jgi:hypothetical protein
MPICRLNVPYSSACGRVLGLLAVFFLASGSAFAQSYDNPGIGEKPVASHPQDYKPLGIRAGAFMLHPGVELAAQWHDNILYTNDNELSDLVWHVRPYITAMSNWSSHSLSVRAAADIARYSDYGFRDYEDYFLQLSGQVDVSSRDVFYYGADYMQLHEERNVRSDEQGIKPTTYTMTGAYAGYDHLFNRFSAGVYLGTRKLDYDNNVRQDGTIIDNQDRDRRNNVISARFGYQFMTDKMAFLDVGYETVDYRLDEDRNGYDRGSSGMFVGAGLDFTITGVLKGDIYARYSSREYDDPLLPDVDGSGLGGGLQWMPTMLTSVRLNLETGIQDTTQATASGYVRNMYALRVDHELLRNLQITGQLSYYTHDYQLLPDAPEGARKSDTYMTADIGATYYINRWSWLSASYKYGTFDTNVEFDDFEANTAWLVLGFER